MKFKSRLILLICLASIVAKAQDHITGQKFIAELGVSCAKTTTGGFMTYSYASLYFFKDSVKVSYYSICSDKAFNGMGASEKMFKYSLFQDSVKIYNFSDYDLFKVQKGALMGLRLSNGNFINQTLFKEFITETVN